ncbi:MAG: class I SAM-dependent RNA methyltransferase [Betaproteobacteria bacterium]
MATHRIDRKESRDRVEVSNRFFASCPRGLEAALADELATLGLAGVAVGNAGVAFMGEWSDCQRANLNSRIASRILWRVGKARYRNEDDIYRMAFALSWHRWFDVERTIRVNVAAIRCPLRSLEFVTLRIKDAVCDRFREHADRRPSVDTVQPDMRIHAFLTEDEVTLYLDTSGDALFKRGWRKRSGEAPLRENLAAGILRLTGWTPDEPLYDSMCGSGTFLVEAAHMALGIAPGRGRGFAFEKFLMHEADPWQRVRDAARNAETPARTITIYGTDTNRAALTAVRGNLQDAGVADNVRVELGDVLEVPAPSTHGVMVANPPYGVRIGDSQELAEFYPSLGNALKQRYAGWRVFLFSADVRLPKLIGLKARRRTPLFNGALECRLYEYQMVEGSLRRPVANAN